VRFRRARGLERQQLRWLAFAAGLASVGAILVLAGTSLPTSPSLTLALIAWGGVCLVLLPLAIGAAVLRYRLYDLDRISRTLAYGLLTVLLGGAYAGVVLGLSQLLGRDSSLVVAVATLAVAALFQPARRRIQAAVDRRFDRRRYDAARTMQAFGARLRQQVDLDTLTAGCLVWSSRPCSQPACRCGCDLSVSVSVEQRSTIRSLPSLALRHRRVAHLAPGSRVGCGCE
jgi:hypothetical protein